MHFYLFILFALFFDSSYSQDYRVSSISKTMQQNADAVVRLDKMDVIVEAKDRMIVNQKRVVTVLNKEGNKHVNAYAFYEKKDKVSHLEAVIYNAQGEEVKKIKKRDFLDQSAIGGGTLYADSRVLVLQYTPTQYPYTVEFSKEYSTPNTAFVPNWPFLEDYRLSTESSQFSFRVECGIPFRTKEDNLDEYQIKKSKTTNGIVYIANNLNAMVEEPLSPSFQDFAPHVKIALNEFHLEGVDGRGATW